MTNSMLVSAQLTRFLIATAVLALVAATGHAQFPLEVMSESFDSRADITGIGVEGGTALTLVNQGGGDNALQFTATSVAGGFFAAGFTISDLQGLSRGRQVRIRARTWRTISCRLTSLSTPQVLCPI